jgi:F-type H+-transporting ATPase subunit beta
MEELSEDDKLHRFPCTQAPELPQPAVHVAETLHRYPGKYVKLEDTLRGFDAIADGKYDDLPEQAFYMVGAIEEVEEKACKLGWSREA